MSKTFNLHGGLQERLCVLCVVGGENFEARAVGVPGGEALGVLSGYAGGSTIRPAKDDRNVEFASGHVKGLGG